jgi:hypothetical protein
MAAAQAVDIPQKAKLGPSIQHQSNRDRPPLTMGQPGGGHGAGGGLGRNARSARFHPFRDLRWCRAVKGARSTRERHACIARCIALAHRQKVAQRGAWLQKPKRRKRCAAKSS